jgi:hypothetical protein
LDSAISPPRVLAGQADDQLLVLALGPGRPRWSPGVRQALEWAPEVHASAEAWSQMRAAKADAIRGQDHAAAALHRDREKVLRERYQLVRTTWLVGLSRPPT